MEGLAELVLKSLIKNKKVVVDIIVREKTSINLKSLLPVTARLKQNDVRLKIKTKKGMKMKAKKEVNGWPINLEHR